MGMRKMEIWEPRTARNTQETLGSARPHVMSAEFGAWRTEGISRPSGECTAAESG